MMELVLHFFTQHASIVQYCWFFFLTFIGAAVTQVLSFQIGTVGAIPFLKMWFKDKTENWYARRNCVLLVLLGTILSFVILEPNSAKTSLFAGLTWCGTLQSLGQTINSDNHG